MIKCELLVGGYSYDVTKDIVNWDDVEMTWKRQDLDGIVRSFTTKFEFCNSAYSLLVGEYLSNYLHSSASVVFYTRNNSWLWDERFRCSLDFSTFTYTGHTCEINAIDDSLASLIKSKKGTQYEYSLDVLKEESMLKYDHLVMTNNAEWMIMTDEEIGTHYLQVRDTTGIIYMYLTKSELIPDNLEVLDNTFKNVASYDIPFKFHVFFRVKIGYDNAGGGGGSFIRGVAELTNIRTNTALVQSDPFELDYFSQPASVDFTYQGLLPRDTALGLRIRSLKPDGSYGGEDIDLELYDISPVTMTATTRNGMTDIPVVSPLKLLNRLLKSMNGGRDGLTGTIASDARLDNTVLVAAESLRGIPNAKLYSSYNKFVEWMKAEFGFVPVIGDKSVSFVHRDSLFMDHVVKVLKDVTDFEFSVDSGKIYSRLNVGYDKVGYEGVNGKDEFRFTQQYTTGVTLTDSSLELKSPYRADAYGIEFLVANSGNDTTDDENDNDVFMIGVTEDYTVDRSVQIEGVLNPGSMFNGMYSQLAMIAANSRYLSSFTDLLEYASSDGNSDVVISGRALNGDINIGNRLFTVGVVNVTTGDTSVPEDLRGLIEVRYNGKIYKGYVSSVSLNLGREESVNYELIVKSIEAL